MSIISDICRACEYMYRLGIYHAAYTGDKRYAMQVAKRDDDYSTWQFLDGDPVVVNGAKVPMSMFLDEIIVLLGKVKAHDLRNYMRLSVTETNGKNVTSVLDYHYRKGLADGCEATREEAKAFFSEVKNGNSHKFFKRKGIFSNTQYLDAVKARINKIHTTRRAAGIPSSLNILGNEVRDEIKEKRRILYGYD